MLAWNKHTYTYTYIHTYKYSKWCQWHWQTYAGRREEEGSWKKKWSKNKAEENNKKIACLLPRLYAHPAPSPSRRRGRSSRVYFPSANNITACQSHIRTIYQTWNSASCASVSRHHYRRHQHHHQHQPRHNCCYPTAHSLDGWLADWPYHENKSGHKGIGHPTHPPNNDCMALEDKDPWRAPHIFDSIIILLTIASSSCSKSRQQNHCIIIFIFPPSFASSLA